MNQKRAWSTAALFIIALIISMPFYVADVYAVSISITKNQGSAGVDGFIDGDGDTWEVEATISDDDNTVQPENVKIKVGNNEDAFNSCSFGGNGSIGSSASTCKYLSSLNDGVISGAYDFSVFYYYPSGLGGNKTASDSGTVKVDGTSLDDGFTDALTINFKSVKQDTGGKGLVLDFTVEDKPPAYCSGLSKIEIIEAAEGVLETIDGFTAGDCNYDYKADKLTNILAVKLSGEGKKYLKIRAVDQLGHEKTSKAISFYADYVAPKVDASSLELSAFGKFIGSNEQLTDISVNITEKKSLDKVTAVSGDADLSGDEASCVEDSKNLGTWVCAWKSVKVQPKSSISIAVTAADSAGNTGTGTATKTLIQDSSAPTADFFGAARTFEDVSYISGRSSVDNMLVLKISETGAGIDEDGILASLAALGGGSAQEPDYFNESAYEAYWDIKYSGSADEISTSLYKFQDKVGNLGALPSANLQVDNTAPKIEKVEIYGSSDAVAEKDYFQSNDKLTIEMKVKEFTGLMILVDLNDVVKDAKNNFDKVKDVYPEADKDYSGWMVFTEDDCVSGKAEDDSVSSGWTCKLETPSIKSGPDSSAELNIEVYDTAGNPAGWSAEPLNIKSGSKGNYVIEILGLDLEDNPDYWEQEGRVKYAPSFIDLETTNLIRTRMAATVPLDSEDAEARLIELSGCVATAQGSNASVSLTRSLLYGGMGGGSGTASPTIVLEFDTFDGVDAFGSALEDAKEKGVFETAEISVACKLKIYSQVGKKATSAAEVQDVDLEIPFAYSELGALDENIDDMIEDIKDTAAFKIPNALKEVNMVLQWVKHIAGIIVTLTQIMTIYKIITAKTESLRNTVVASYMAPLICESNAAAQKLVYKLPEYIQIPIQLFSCQPLTHTTTKDGKTKTEAWGWYGRWQEQVLNIYNIGSGRIVTVPATSLYENIYTSIAGLCVPGVLYNLEKLRQVQCRYISCLKNEVPAGIATMDSCKKMHEYLTCRYWAGPFFKLTPLAAIDIVLNYFKSWYASLGDPLSAIRLSVQAICAATCIASNTASAACTYLGLIVKGLDLLDSLYGAFTAYPSVTGDPYCGSLDLGAFD